VLLFDFGDFEREVVFCRGFGFDVPAFLDFELVSLGLGAGISLVVSGVVARLALLPMVTLTLRAGVFARELFVRDFDWVFEF